MGSDTEQIAAANHPEWPRGREVPVVGVAAFAPSALWRASPKLEERRRGPHDKLKNVRMRELGPGGVDRWKATDRLDVFHYGYGERRAVHYALYEDAQRYDAFSLKLDVPTVIIYGTCDQSVDPESVEQWARGRSNVTLRPVDDGHQLTDSLDVIWQESAKALGLER